VSPIFPSAHWNVKRRFPSTGYLFAFESLCCKKEKFPLPFVQWNYISMKFQVLSSEDICSLIQVDQSFKCVYCLYHQDDLYKYRSLFRFAGESVTYLYKYWHKANIVVYFTTVSASEVIILGRSNQGDWGGWDMWYAWERRGKCTGFFWGGGSPKERGDQNGSWEDWLGV
jgi:hypothetical protein